MRPHHALACAAFALFAVNAVATGAEECAATRHETPLQSAQGSAGIMVNLAETEDSIRGVARSLLGAALQSAAKAQAPAVVFRVSPTTYLPLSQQQPLCTTLATETASRPLKYADRSFTSVEQFDAWLMAFAQGQGEDGKLLYTQCGGNCDPSFTFLVSQATGVMRVATEVYCGYARDRKINLYTLSTTLRAACTATR
jgi:hypothetical protein